MPAATLPRPHASAQLPRALAVLLFAAGLAGCASAPLPSRIDEGQALQLVVQSSEAATGQVAIRNRDLGKGASRGTGAGAVVGGLWGLACGPLFWICSPLAAAVVAVPGAAAGTLVGATAALPEGKAAQLRQRLAERSQAHDLRADLLQQLQQRAQARWRLDGQPADWVLTVEFQDITLSSDRDEQIGLQVRVAATLQRLSAPPGSAPPPRIYEFSAAPSSLAVWLDTRSDFLDTLISSCTQQLAAQIVSDLSHS